MTNKDTIEAADTKSPKINATLRC